MSRAWAKSPRIARRDDDGEPRGHEQRDGAEERDQPLFRGPVVVGADEQHLADHEDGDERDPEHRQQPVLTGPRSRLGARLDGAHWSDWLSAAIETR